MKQGSEQEKNEGVGGPVEAVAEPVEAMAEDANAVEGEATIADGADGEAAVEPEAVDSVAQLQEELAAAHAKADEYLDKLQRSAAEFQNSRRRLENQLSDAVDRANAGLISRLLPVLDDLDLAFRNVPQELTATDESGAEEAWLQGFRQIRKKLLDVLSDQGVTPVETGGEFDPNQHEAISSEPNEEVESGHIIAEVRAGYVYKGRVLRPALVRVAA
jgi:molecular chaperone GrpE